MTMMDVSLLREYNQFGNAGDNSRSEGFLAPERRTHYHPYIALFESCVKIIRVARV